MVLTDPLIWTSLVRAAAPALKEPPECHSE
jgi:hypothetical protein